MGNRRIVSSTLLVGTCALIVIVGMANAGKGPEARVEVERPQTQPADARATLEAIIEQAKLTGPSPEGSPLPPVPLPAGFACPGTEGVQNIHRRLGPPPDYVAQGQALGMSDAETRAYAASLEAAEKQLHDQMIATVATLPLPPCP